jgi:PAS domain S-box-containing protein
MPAGIRPMTGSVNRMPPTDRPKNRLDVPWIRPLGIAWTASLVLGAMAVVVFFFATRAHEIAGVRARLLSVADSREASVRRWIQDQFDNLSVAAAGPAITEFLATRSPPTRTASRRFLNRACALYGLEGLILFDREGTERLRIGEAEPPDVPHNADFAREVLASGLPSRIFLHAHAAGGPERVSLAIPVFDAAAGIAGVLVMEQDPARSLYPIVQEDPVLTKTMETLFVRPYQDGVRFVSPLRLAPEWGLGRIIEHPPERLAGLAAIRGERRFGEFLDYRDQPVFAVTRRIEETEWGVVVKMDRSEALAAWKADLTWFVIALGSVLAAFAALLWGTRKSLLERWYRERSNEDRRFRSLIEQSGDAIAVVDRSGFILANPAFRELWGLPADRPIGSVGLPDLFPAEELAQLQDYLEDAAGARRRREPVEVIVTAPDRRVLELEIQAAPVSYEGISALQVVFRDISQRRRASERMRLMEFTINNATDTVAWIREDGTLAYVNEAFCAMTGFRPDEAVGLPIWKIDLAMDEGSWREYWEMVKAQGAASLATEMVNREGGRTPVDVSSRFIDFGGEQYVCSFGRDISDWRNLEEQLHQSQKMEAVGRLAGGIAHDFNNLLTIVTGNAELGLRTLEEDHPLHNRLQTVLKAANSAADLTRKLLTFSRKQMITPQVLDLNRVLGELVGMIGPLIGEDVRLEIHPAATPLHVRIDPSQLEQILVNLVINAREAMPEGGRLQIESGIAALDAEWIHTRPYARIGRFVRLTVRDSGHGMDEETLLHVFEPFFTTKSYGSGLGLATVYGIVKQNLGFIEMESTPGEGTTVYILLPEVKQVPE